MDDPSRRDDLCLRYYETVMVKKSFLSAFVLSWLKGGSHYGTHRSETKISVKHLLF